MVGGRKFSGQQYCCWNASSCREDFDCGARLQKAHIVLALFSVQSPSKMYLCSWAAYVAGALLVLMHEEGHTFDRGVSLLVSSEVPDGKGVSSSAALEVGHDTRG